MLIDLPPELIQIIIDWMDVASAISLGYTCQALLIFQPKTIMYPVLKALVCNNYQSLIMEWSDGLEYYSQVICCLAVEANNIVITRWALFHGAIWLYKCSDFLACCGDLNFIKKMYMFIPENHLSGIVYTSAVESHFHIVKWGVKNKLIGGPLDLINLFIVVITKQHIPTLQYMINKNPNLKQYVQTYAEYHNCLQVIDWINSC